ncbi:MAG: hypothetical protein IJS08_01195 [Victivallales bacterium]|nr:hypothetical protein [Victivallales bacterium]
MKLYKTTTVIAIATLFALSVIFAQEVPTAKQFSEITRDIMEKVIVNQREHGAQSAQVKINTERIKDKINAYHDCVNEYRNALEASANDSSPETLEARQAAYDRQEKALSEVAEAISNDIDMQMKFTEETCKRLMDISKSYDKLAVLIDRFKFGLKGTDTETIDAMVRSNIKSVGKQLIQLRELDPHNKAINNALAVVNNQAKLYKQLDSSFTTNERIREQAEILRDLSASLLYAREALKAQKDELKIKIVAVTIKHLFGGMKISLKPGGELPGEFIKGIGKYKGWLAQLDDDETNGSDNNDDWEADTSAIESL